MKKFEDEKMNLLLEFLLLNSLFYILDIFYKTKIMKENNELKSYFFYFLILPIFFFRNYSISQPRHSQFIP